LCLFHLCYAHLTSVNQALGYDDMKLRLKAIKQALIFNIDDYSIVYSHVKFAYFYSFSLIYF